MRIGWPRSLIRRILLVEFAAIAGAALLLPLLLVAVLNRTSARYQNAALLHQARAIGRSLTAGGLAGRPVLTGEIEPAFASAYDGRAFVVVDDAGHLQLASRYAGALRLARIPRRAGPVAFRAPPLVGAGLPVAVGGHRYWVVVSQDETRPGAILDDVRRAVLPRYLAVLVPILLLLPLANSLLIRRLVREVQAVSTAAAAIGAQTLDARLPSRDLPAEVAPLVDATNALLARLEASFAQQAQFVGDVTHELRTPLATVRLLADGLPDAGVRKRLAAQVERLTHVVGQLHDLATLENPGSVHGQFDLAELARDTLVDLVADALARDHPIELVAPDDPVPVPGNRVLVGLALANLVSNAVRHTPAGTRVTVTVMTDREGRGVLAVADDGPGIAAWSTDELTRRFWRADHARSDSAGLGLAIVRRICAVHGAALEIGASAAGGASFTIRLRSPVGTDKSM